MEENTKVQKKNSTEKQKAQKKLGASDVKKYISNILKNKRRSVSFFSQIQYSEIEILQEILTESLTNKKSERLKELEVLKKEVEREISQIKK